MRKTIEASSHRASKIKDLPKIYLIGCWAHFGVREYPFSGKCTPEGIPLVWDYNDFNGTQDLYVLTKLTNVTTGSIFAWTTSRRLAETTAERLEKTASWSNNCPRTTCGKCVHFEHYRKPVEDFDGFCTACSERHEVDEDEWCSRGEPKHE